MTGAAPLLLLAVVIGANNLATALALGALGQAHRRARAVAVFGLFELVVPLVGLWLGQQAASRLATGLASWLGPLLLIGLGALALRAALRDGGDDEALARRVTSWGGLAALGASLSVDNLLVGFSLGLGDAPPLTVAATICAASMAFTWLGISLGDGARRHWERRAGVAAGLLLIGMGAALGSGWL